MYNILTFDDRQNRHGQYLRTCTCITIYDSHWIMDIRIFYKEHCKPDDSFELIERCNFITSAVECCIMLSCDNLTASYKLRLLVIRNIVKTSNELFEIKLPYAFLYATSHVCSVVMHSVTCPTSTESADFVVLTYRRCFNIT